MPGFRNIAAGTGTGPFGRLYRWKIGRDLISGVRSFDVTTRGFRVFFVLALSTFLWSCTNAGLVPPQNLASVLTPQSVDSDATETANADLETALVETDTPVSDDSVTGSVSEPSSTDETQQASTESAEGEPDTVADAAEPETGAETTTALASHPEKAANPFAAFMKGQSAAQRPRANVGDTTEQARSTFRKPANNRQVARLTVTRSSAGAAKRASTGTLPGVKMKNVFAIDEEETGESDYLEKGESEAVRVASLTNMARRGDHGLLLQRPDVSVGCFTPDLLRILKSVERKFNRTPVITSGYRSPSYNRKIRGAKKSLHVRCLAADIQVQGVSKWTLAKYLRGLPGRGGVGTYCHTQSVHIDIGTKRDWNRRCRRKKSA